ncbi:MAG TPA: zinc ribbon domain-containing protein [Candidatus Hydrogenedentes bacterium]|nr:zinc ribbon domain-containing protein [Candidatus Hydrogenedentota bacterium]
MPLFAYQCEQCGHVAEFLEKSGDRKRHECPECNGRRMKKLAATFGVGKSTTTASSACPTGTCPLS